MKILIIGSGAQGSDIAKYLVKRSDVSQIMLADIDLKKAQETAERVNKEKVSPRRLDASNSEEILEAAKGVDVVVNAVIPKFNLTIMEEALKAGANYVDLASGPPYENIERQLELSDRWKDRGITALINTGISPGVTNVVIACCADKLDHVDEIRIIGGSKIRPGAQFVEGKEILGSSWSPETFWSDMLSPPVVFEDGEWKTVPPFSGEEIYEFPEPLGPCTVVDHIHEEVFTIPRFIGKGLKSMHVKFGWFPGILIAKAVSELGLWSDEPIEVKGVKVAPRDLFLKLIKPIPTTEELISKIEARALIEQVGASIMEIKGEKGGIQTTYRASAVRRGTYRSIYEAYEEYGRSFLERPGIVGVSAAIFTHMLGGGEIKTRGVIPPEALGPEERETFLVRLAEQGFIYNLSVERRLI